MPASAEAIVTAPDVLIISRRDRPLLLVGLLTMDLLWFDDYPGKQVGFLQLSCNL